MSFKEGFFYPSNEIRDYEDLLSMTLKETIVTPENKLRIIKMGKTRLTKKNLLGVILDTYLKTIGNYYYATTDYIKSTNNWLINYIIFDMDKSLVLIVTNIKEDRDNSNDIVIYYKELNIREMKEHVSAIATFHKNVRKRLRRDFNITAI